MARPDRRVFASVDEIAAFIGDELVRLKPKTLGLSGGHTPEDVYRALAERQDIDWGAIDFFWSDERCVPPDHPDSNYGMARRALLSRAPIDPANVHRIEGELGADDAARHYDAELRRFAPDGLDVLLLGVGEDGHTASLFPDSSALAEARHWATPSRSPTGQERVTLTYPYIGKCRRVFIVAAGRSKEKIVARALGERSAGLPVQAVTTAVWLIDSEAAAASPQV